MPQEDANLRSAGGAGNRLGRVSDAISPSEGPRPASPRELQETIFQERKGRSFLVYRSGAGELCFVPLAGQRALLSVGRSATADLCLEWDGEVSGLHAQLEVMAGETTLIDDGLSRNGSFVNSERVRGRRRPRDGDMLRFGRTVVQFRIPLIDVTDSTVRAADLDELLRLSPQQRKVLLALCRPFLAGDDFATPPSNQQIAGELFLSVDAIKLHLRALFEKFGVADLGQNKKRLALIGRAMQSGVLRDGDA